MTKIAVIGLGEAGGTYAEALVAAGHQVWGVDPADVETPAGVQRVAELPVSGLDVVLVVTSARVAGILSETTLPRVGPGTVWVDMTTASPGQKAAAVQRAAAGVGYVDIAILGPVIQQGTDTPLLVAGADAEPVAELLRTIGAPVEVVPDGRPGDAMAHKLLRSILMKGLAAIVTEAVTAGIAAGRESWIRDQIAAQLAGDGRATLERFLTGSVKHAARRSEEMGSVVEYPEELGVRSDMSNGARNQLVALREV